MFFIANQQSLVAFLSMTIEFHPLTPFLPRNARVLFLGSFPPPKFRWSMEFFYPNWINDFWRIMGIIFFEDKSIFEIKEEKRFDKDRIVEFAQEQGLALFDTATKVKRLNDDASDKFLEILEPTNVVDLLEKIPDCHRIVTTGGKASDELLSQLSGYIDWNGAKPDQPKVGEKISFKIGDRDMEWWRMPSSSRAYPLAIEKKAEQYKKLFSSF